MLKCTLKVPPYSSFSHRLSLLSKENKQQPTAKSIHRANDRFIIQHISVIFSSFALFLFFSRLILYVISLADFYPHLHVLLFHFFLFFVVSCTIHGNAYIIFVSLHIFLSFFVLDFSSFACRLLRRV